MALELIGYVPHSATALPSGHRNEGGLDVAFIEEAARAQEQAGFDRVLIAHASNKPDAWQLAAHVGHVTEKLKVLVAARPGVTHPSLVARQAATFDQLTRGGRLAVHVISGGDEREQQREGDFLGHDERYERSAEFIALLRRMWSAREPFDHDGKYYPLRGAYSAVLPASDIPVYFAGGSDAAIRTGSQHADLFVLNGAPLAQTQALIARIEEAAAPHARRPRFGIGLRLLLGETEEAAWERARAIAGEADKAISEGKAIADGANRVKSDTFTAVGARQVYELALSGEIHDERLWLGYTQRFGGGGTTATLVGTPEQVTRSLVAYSDAGISAFYLRGFDIIADAREYGEKLIPLLRQATA